MVRSSRTLWFFAGIVLVALIVTLVLEWFFQLTAGDRIFYFIDHYLFGVGGPFFFALPCGTGGTPLPEPKFLPRVSLFLRRYGFEKLGGNGFWVGIIICEAWSIGREILVYWVLNPKHGADWGHWASDLAGMLTAYMIYRFLLAMESRQALATKTE